jgi:hypothetical protein
MRPQLEPVLRALSSAAGLAIDPPQVARAPRASPVYQARHDGGVKRHDGRDRELRTARNRLCTIPNRQQREVDTPVPGRHGGAHAPSLSRIEAHLGERKSIWKLVATRQNGEQVRRRRSR